MSSQCVPSFSSVYLLSSDFFLRSLPLTPPLFPPHMGFTFGFAEHSLNVILWYIIWSHLLAVTTSHMDTSQARQREVVRFCPGELWPFNLTLFTVVIIYSSWKCSQNTNCAYVDLCLSLSFSLKEPVGGFHPLLLLAVNRPCQRCVCACVREQKVRNLGVSRGLSGNCAS